MSYITGFYKGRLGIGLTPTMGMGDGNPRFPLDINGDIRLTGDILNENGLSLLGSSANGTFVLTDISNVVLGNDNYKVGIGTTSPKTKLQIGGQENYPSYISNSEDALCVMHSTATSSTAINDPKPCLILGRPGTSGQTQSSAAIFNIHRYENNSVNAMTQLSIDLLHGGNATTDNVLVCRSNGNVGIGTTSPTTLLQIKGNGDSNNVQLLIENESYNKGIQFQYKSASSTTYNFPQARIWTSGSSYDTKLYFSTAKGSSNSNTVLSTAMTIDYDGNVGIGTDDPQRKLHIKGGTGINGDIRLEMGYGPGAGWGAYTDLNSIEFYAPDNGIPNTGKVAYRLTHQVYEGHGNSILVMKATEANGNTESNLMTWKHGYVGIGTRTPEYKLDIRGSGEQIINVYSDGTAGTSGAYARFSYNNNADAGLLYVGALSDSVMVNSRFNYPMIFYIDNVEKMKIKTNGHIDINKGHVDGWVDSHEGNNRINLNDQNFGVGAGKFALDMGSSNSECTAIWCYQGGGRGIRFCSTLNGDNDKFSDMTTRMIIKGDNGNVGIGPLMTNPSYRLDVNGDFRVYPWGTTISGNIDMEDGSTYDANTFYVWHFPTGPMDAGNCITVKIGRGVHTSGGWYGGSCLVVTFVPSHWGYLGYSQYFVHHYSTRDDTTIGRVQCHGQWSYGAIALRGDRKYHYVIREGGHPYLSGDSTFTSAETITVGSVVSQSWSDDRIKHNETKIINGLDVINKLNPLRYIKTMHKMYDKDHKFELEDDGTPIDTSGNKLGVNAWIIENGIIAQEVEKIDELKHAVGKSTAQDASGNIIKTVKYNDVFVYNIAATQELDKKIIALENKTEEIKNTKNIEDILLKSNKYEKNNTENIIGNIPFVNGFTTVNDKKIYNKNISDKLYFNPETSKLYCSNIESTYYGDGSNLQGIAKLSQIEHLIEDNKRLIQDNENNKELINFWTKQAMNLNNKLTTVETKLANVENELKLIKENLGL